MTTSFFLTIGKRYDIIDRCLYVTAAPIPRHQLIAAGLLHFFMTYLDTHPIGIVLAAPCDVLLNTGEDIDIVQPDLFFIRHDGAARVTEKNIEGSPDLIIEILSPSTVARDRQLKHKRYEQFGARGRCPSADSAARRGRSRAA